MKRTEKVENLRRDLESIVEALELQKTRTRRIEGATEILARAIMKLAKPGSDERRGV